MRVVPYVSFNGTCEEAITFYQKALGGTVDLIRFDTMPEDAGMPISPAWKQKIMHGALTLGSGVLIYFGDSWENQPVETGSNTTLHVQVDSEPEVKRIVDALSEGGQVTMPADRTFWGSTYGSLIDRYGVHWGIEFELPQTDA